MFKRVSDGGSDERVVLQNTKDRLQGRVGANIANLAFATLLIVIYAVEHGEKGFEGIPAPKDISTLGTAAAVLGTSSASLWMQMKRGKEILENKPSHERNFMKVGTAAAAINIVVGAAEAILGNVDNGMYEWVTYILCALIMGAGLANGAQCEPKNVDQEDVVDADHDVEAAGFQTEVAGPAVSDPAGPPDDDGQEALETAPLLHIRSPKARVWNPPTD